MKVMRDKNKITVSSVYDQFDKKGNLTLGPRDSLSVTLGTIEFNNSWSVNTKGHELTERIKNAEKAIEILKQQKAYLESLIGRITD